MTHLLRFAAALAFILFLTLLPFLPGRYDPVAALLSWMSRILGFAGILLVPVGLLWLAFARGAGGSARHCGFAIAAAIVASLIGFMIAVGTAALGSLSIGGAVLALWIYALVRLPQWLRRLKAGTQASRTSIALFLVILPGVVLPLQLWVVPRAVELSRSRAIENSAPLIAAIEQYRAAHGRYPLSLVSVWPDYQPGLVGVPEFRYEPRGESYNLIFEQPSLNFGTREFVVYNLRDEQVMTSHAMDLLQRSPEQLALEWRRGHYAVHHAAQPHWKYFWFD